MGSPFCEQRKVRLSTTTSTSLHLQQSLRDPVSVVDNCLPQQDKRKGKSSGPWLVMTKVSIPSETTRQYQHVQCIRYGELYQLNHVSKPENNSDAFAAIKIGSSTWGTRSNASSRVSKPSPPKKNKRTLHSGLFRLLWLSLLFHLETESDRR